MHRREFLRNAFGLVAVAAAITTVASPTEAATALMDPRDPDKQDGRAEHELRADQTEAGADDTLEVGARRGGRGRHRGWGRGRRGWGRRRRVRWGWHRRRRWWGWRRRRWRRRLWRRGWRRRYYY